MLLYHDTLDQVCSIIAALYRLCTPLIFGQDTFACGPLGQQNDEGSGS